MVTIGVVIPAYNHARWLPRAVDSVLKQTSAANRIVVVDDGSTDETEAVAASYGEKITYIRQANGGVSSARNLGISSCETSHVAFLDADDFWTPTKLASQSHLAETSGAGVVYSSVLIVDGNGHPTGLEQATVRGRVFEKLLFGNAITGGGSSTLVLRDLLLQTRGFDRDLSTSADWDLWLRLSKLTTFEYVESAETFYTVHSSGMHHRLDAAIADSDRILEKLGHYCTLPSERALLRPARARRRRLLAGHALHKREYAAFCLQMARCVSLNPLESLYALALPGRVLARSWSKLRGRAT